MLRWVFGADTGPFNRGLNDMRGQVGKFSGSVKGMIAGALGLGAVISGFRNLFVEMDRVQKLGLRFGESAETIQKLGLAADLAGSSLEGIAKAMTLVTRNASAAARDGGAMGEAFKRLGIDASAFVNLPLDQKVLLLSKAFTESQGSGEGLANMMEVLGRSGGDLIPLLSQGLEELQSQFDKTSTVSQATVDKIAAFNDAITSAKQKAQVFGGSLIAAFSDAMPYMERFINRFFDFATGNKLAEDIFKDRMDAKNAPSENKGAAPTVEDLQAQAEAALKVDEERAKLSAEIAKLEEDARIRALDLTEKILDAEKRRAELAAEAIFGQDETKALEARKEQLKIEKDLETLRKQAADEQAKADDEKAKVTQEYANTIATLAQESADIERSNKMAGMSDEERRDFLSGERDQALQDQRAANESGDAVGSLEAGNRAASLTGEIDSISRGLAADAQSELDRLQSRGPTIATSSLAEIGGGGGARMMEHDYLKKQVDLLAIIAANTAGGSEGTKPPEPI